MNGGRRPPAIWLKILIKPKIFESRKTDTKHLTKRARCGILYTVRGAEPHTAEVVWRRPSSGEELSSDSQGTYATSLKSLCLTLKSLLSQAVVRTPWALVGVPKGSQNT